MSYKNIIDLEKAVLRAIGGGYNTFSAIEVKVLSGNFRATDRAMQKLRKKGRIKWDGKVWALVLLKDCGCEVPS